MLKILFILPFILWGLSIIAGLLGLANNLIEVIVLLAISTSPFALIAAFAIIINSSDKN